jgi:hypothetical protein
MIAVAHADGIIQTEEVAGIEKIYRILALIHRRPIRIYMRERWPTRLFGSDRQTRLSGRANSGRGHCSKAGSGYTENCSHSF